MQRNMKMLVQPENHLSYLPPQMSSAGSEGETPDLIAVDLTCDFNRLLEDYVSACVRLGRRDIPLV
jgi:hypothetical protein